MRTDPGCYRAAPIGSYGEADPSIHATRGVPLAVIKHSRQFYIGGNWVEPLVARTLDVVNPATLATCGVISLGSARDVDRAVDAARRAFPAYSASPLAVRKDLIGRIIDACLAREDAFAQAMQQEMGSPISFARSRQTREAMGPFREMLKVLDSYAWQSELGGLPVHREAIGVAGLITPWNWPVNAITSKLAAALAAGCTVVLKPSEFSPLSAILLAEAVHEAGVPAGVFNLVNGEGPQVGRAIAQHAGIDIVSFTGSTRAGIQVAKDAADSVKRVVQELGGKSANIVLPDADLATAIPFGVRRCFTNSGQSCQAPTRMLVHSSQRAEVLEIARATAQAIRVGDPTDPAVDMGPVANRAQFEKVRQLIQQGIEEGAHLLCGGLDRPGEMEAGYFVQPTIFADVTPAMTIAQEEIFGPVLCILCYDTEDEAVEIANDSRFGLAGYVQSRDVDRARRVGARMRAGRIYINGHPGSNAIPFGGYKHSGNGRQQGVYGLEEFLEAKAYAC